MIKILIVVSAADKVALKEGGFYPTGFHLGELAEPLKIFLDQGLEVDFATPGGIKPSIDPHSLKVKNKSELLKIVNGQPGLKKPLRLESLRPENLVKYDGLFIPGGHAPMTDLNDNPSVGTILNYFHQNQKPTALLCHAPVSLLSAGDTYSGYNITCFPKKLEQLLEMTRFKGHLTYYIDDELKKRGLKIKNTFPPIPCVVKDRELITGQDPFAAKKLAEEFSKILLAK